jgi:hypothetical protein
MLKYTEGPFFLTSVRFLFFAFNSLIFKPVILGLSMHVCHDVKDCLRLMDTGFNNRHVGATLMNKDSSRFVLFFGFLKFCYQTLLYKSFKVSGKI